MLKSKKSQKFNSQFNAGFAITPKFGVSAVKTERGFTLIELLVVIAIIGLLASMVLVSLNSARRKGRITKRLGDISQIRKALELYYNNNNAYPNSYTGNPSGWRSQCPGWGTYAQDQVIPGLVPTIISRFPADPAMGVGNANYNCYLYKSDGTDYKFMIFNLEDMTTAEINATQFSEPWYHSQNLPPCNNANPPTKSMSIYTTAWQCQG
jgi:prepilin-type N-terminal cleavage/methylation domain-containing protein